MEMMNVTKATMAWELHQQGVPKAHISQRLGKHRETIHLWIKGVEREGLMAFLDRYLNAKKGPRPKRRTSPMVKRWVWEYGNGRRDAAGRR